MRVITMGLIALAFMACSTAPSAPGEAEAAAQGSGKTYTEGTDYLVLKRVRAMDPSGLAQPVEAYSVLVPRDWVADGGITWKLGGPCPIEVVHNRFTAKSPDGAYRFDFYPTQQWDWNDDAQMRYALQDPAQRRCTIAEPMDASTFLKAAMAQEIGAEVVSVDAPEYLNAPLQAEAQRQQQQLAATGITNIEYRPSVAVATLRFPDGSSGMALCAITMQLTHMPNMITGGQMTAYSCQTTTKSSLKFPKGKEKEAENLFTAILKSFRANPEWTDALQRMFTNIGRMEQNSIAERQRIAHDAQTQIGEMQVRDWEGRQAEHDRTAEAWSQTIRGVDAWQDGQGGRVELMSGYENAWSRPDGTYLLSNDPSFDPNVVLQENWQRLEKGR